MLFLHVLLFSLVGIALGAVLDPDKMGAEPKRLVAPGDDSDDDLALKISISTTFNGIWSRYNKHSTYKRWLIKVDAGDVFHCIDNGIAPPTCTGAFTSRDQFESITGLPAWSKTEWPMTGMRVSGMKLRGGQMAHWHRCQ